MNNSCKLVSNTVKENQSRHVEGRGERKKANFTTQYTLQVAQKNNKHITNKSATDKPILLREVKTEKDKEYK